MVINYRPPPPEEDVVNVRTRRLQIPVCENRQLMRDVAEIVKGLGNDMDVWSRLLDRTEEEMETMIEKKIKRANEDIRAESERHGIKWRTGRPTNVEMRRMGMPVPRTVETEPINLTQHIEKLRHRR